MLYKTVCANQLMSQYYQATVHLCATSCKLIVTVMLFALDTLYSLFFLERMPKSAVTLDISSRVRLTPHPSHRTARTDLVYGSC